MSTKSVEKDMNLVGHLTELRNRLIVTAVFFVIAFLTSFTFIKNIYAFFEADIDFQLTITSPADTIWVYFTMAGIVALAVTLPLLALQVWLFIKPALTSSERKTSLPYVPVIFLLFVGGLVFGYFIFIQLILPFLLSLNDGMFNELFTVNRYFKFLFRMTLPFAFVFEIPIIAMFLTSIGILTPAFLRKSRKYAYFILLIVGALLTPPDIILQITVAIPMFILYEISIYLSKVVYRKKEKKHQAFMESNQSE